MTQKTKKISDFEAALNEMEEHRHRNPATGAKTAWNTYKTMNKDNEGYWHKRFVISLLLTCKEDVGGKMISFK